MATSQNYIVIGSCYPIGNSFPAWAGYENTIRFFAGSYGGSSMSKRHTKFTPIHTIVVPLVYEGPGLHALDIARLFDAEVTLVGVVVVPPDQSLSMGNVAARALRKLLQNFARAKNIANKSQVIVSYEPWHELSKIVQDSKPDLLCLEFEAHLKALHVNLSTVLTRPPCNVALVRGKITSRPKQVLVPVRGGPHAELALRVGLGLRPTGISTLHRDRSEKWPPLAACNL